MLTVSSYSGDYFESDYKIAIVASEFNSQVVDQLIQAAQHTLSTHQIKTVTLLKVPGAFELPFAAQLMTANHDAVVVLGAIIRGETPHFEFICQACANGIMSVTLQTGIPIAFGILTTDTLAQAMARANHTPQATTAEQHQPQSGGSHAAIVALRLASLRRQLKRGQK